MPKGFGVSPLTNRIFYGTSKDLGNGVSQFTGKKEDVTDEVVLAVFELFYNKAITTGRHEVAVPGYGRMTFERVMKKVGDGND